MQTSNTKAVLKKPSVVETCGTRETILWCIIYLLDYRIFYCYSCDLSFVDWLSYISYIVLWCTIHLLDFCIFCCYSCVIYLLVLLNICVNRAVHHCFAGCTYIKLLILRCHLFTDVCLLGFRIFRCQMKSATSAQFASHLLSLIAKVNYLITHRVHTTLTLVSEPDHDVVRSMVWTSAGLLLPEPLP